MLGTGCANCRTTVAADRGGRRARRASRSRSSKVEDMRDDHGLRRDGHARASSIDGKVVHAGGVPRREKIETWLA
ncbi:MAG: thioredoxin family protein [Comamonadaceae bacterium]|nr:thioredoxin family protein [Comamonadaceae bacterium]